MGLLEKQERKKEGRKERDGKRGGKLVEEASWDCIESEMRLFSEGKGQKKQGLG